MRRASYPRWKQACSFTRMSDWVITLPKTVEWVEYERELEAARGGSQVLNYRVHCPPRQMAVGDRCYIAWRGRVRGWMSITGIVNHEDGFTCSTTGACWSPGWYIQRAGEFHKVDGPKMDGFRGVRSFKPAALADNQGIQRR